jgi:cell division protein WhiA
MSFARDVKQEIAHVELSDCCVKAELYAFIQLKSSLMISENKLKLEFQTTSNTIARRISYLFNRAYQAKLEMLVKKRSNLDRKSLYWIVLQNQAEAILKDLGILDDEYGHIEEIPRHLIEKECCKISFLRGAFLARGSINDPEKSRYHMEIVAEQAWIAPTIVSLLHEIGVDAKVVTRPKGEVVYSKKAEAIGDFLRYVGAVNQLFHFEDIRIKKDLSNYVNRIINCDLANEEKALQSAAKQLDNIRIIQEKKGLMNLPQRLLDAIYLRNSHPDDSLSQLSDKSEESIGKYISKSGLSHCFRDLEKIANEYKKPHEELHKT